jgi:hypothetical protein
MRAAPPVPCGSPAVAASRVPSGDQARLVTELATAVRDHTGWLAGAVGPGTGTSGVDVTDVPQAVPAGSGGRNETGPELAVGGAVAAEGVAPAGVAEASGRVGGTVDGRAGWLPHAASRSAASAVAMARRRAVMATAR